MSVLLERISPAERRRGRELAELLDGSRAVSGHELAPLVELATTLRPAPPALPALRDERRSALREELLAEAERLAPQRRAAGTGGGRAAKADPGPSHRGRRLVATVAVLGLAGGVGAAAASTHALPGDALYGVKRGLESVQLRLAHSDLSRGRELLDQARTRLAEAQALAAGEDGRSPQTRARIRQALADMTAATDEGVAEMRTSYLDTGETEPLVELRRFVVAQREGLADLAALLDPRERALLAPAEQALAAWDTELGALLAGSGSAAGSPGVSAGPADTDLALARDSGDGWAVGLLLTRIAGRDPATTGAASGTGGASGGGTGDLAGAVGGTVRDTVDGVTQGVGGLVDGITGGTGGSGGSPGAGGSTGSSTPRPSTPATSLPLPTVTIPPVTVSPVPEPSAVSSLLPTLPTLPTVTVSLPPLP